MLVWLFRFEQFCVSLTNINMHFKSPLLFIFFPQFHSNLPTCFGKDPAILYLVYNYISDTQESILRKSKGKTRWNHNCSWCSSRTNPMLIVECRVISKSICIPRTALTSVSCCLYDSVFVFILSTQNYTSDVLRASHLVTPEVTNSYVGCYKSYTLDLKCCRTFHTHYFV